MEIPLTWIATDVDAEMGRFAALELSATIVRSQTGVRSV